MAFIQIDRNMFFDKEVVDKIGAEGLTLYCLLLTRRGLNPFTDFTIKSITTYTDRKSDTVLKYSDKDRKVPRLKSLPIIRKYLKVLADNGYIKIKNNVNLDKVGLNDIIIVTIKQNLEQGFIQVDIRLFIKYVNEIGHNGWLIFCILHSLHNETYGEGGYANPTLEYLKNISGISTKTISVYIDLLKEVELIKIKKVPPTMCGKDKHGNDLWTYYPNIYRVNCKLQGDNYYLSNP